MKRMNIYRASDWSISEVRNIATVEDLINVAKDYDNHSIIITFGSPTDDTVDGDIMIYDDWIE